MRIFVTGTAGFIGFHLARSLLNDGHQVVGFDNFNDYYPPVLKEHRNAVLEKETGFTCIRGELTDREKVISTVRDGGFDLVCHLAAQAGVRYSIDHPFTYAETNLIGFLAILEACRHARVPRLVYASSSSVYGKNTKLPFSENDPVNHPISLYAATKKANELIAHTYTHLYGLQTIGLRFFTVYGPWGRPDMAMWIFSDKIQKGEPIPVFNHGNMRRDFTFVDDIVQGVKKSLFAGGLQPCEVLNLGNHQSENLLEMIEILGEYFGTQPKMDLLPMQPGDVPATYADIELARAKLGFVPVTPIREGIRQFVAWYKDHDDLVSEVRALSPFS